MRKEKVMDESFRHMLEHHAINPEEMTACMKLKIKENIHMTCDSIDIFLQGEALFCFCRYIIGSDIQVLANINVT